MARVVQQARALRRSSSSLVRSRILLFVLAALAQGLGVRPASAAPAADVGSAEGVAFRRFMHDLVAASGSYLSSFTLAVTEVTERANLPMLTLSYSDLITQRGFKYIFQTSATSGSQTEQSLPVILETATSAGASPKTVAIVTDTTAA